MDRAVTHRGVALAAGAGLLLLAPLAPAADDGRLRTLREQFEAAVEAATRPVADRFAAELEKLKRAYAQAGDLEMALAAESQLERIKARPQPYPVEGKWKWATGGSITFRPNGTVQHSGWTHNANWHRVAPDLFRIDDGKRVFVVFLSSADRGWAVLMGTRGGTRIDRLKESE